MTLTPGKLILAKDFRSFNPSDIETALWLDAADASTITESGGSVSQWNDKSGNGRDFDQSITANQPSVSSAVLNGLNGVAFDLDFLNSTIASSTWTFLHDGTKWRSFSVVRFGNTADPNAVYGFIGTSRGASADVGVALYFEDRSSLSKSNSMTASIARGITGASSVFHSTQNDFIFANAFTIYEYFADPGNATAANRSQHFNAAVPSTTVNSFLNPPSPSPPTNNLQIGALGANAAPTVMTLCEFVIYNGDMPSTDVEKMQGYLAHKWGLTANLPADHPYKTVEPTP